MKNVSKFFLPVVVAVLFLLAPITVSAHPGRTDGNGCHTCWTNCENWGLEYGEYHCHNGGSSSSSSSGNVTWNPPTPVPTRVTIVQSNDKTIQNDDSNSTGTSNPLIPLIVGIGGLGLLKKIFTHSQRKKDEDANERPCFLGVSLTGDVIGNYDEILQVCIINYLGKAVYNQYFKPDHRVRWPKAQKFHGISPLLVKDGKRLNDELPKIEWILNRSSSVIGFDLFHGLEMLRISGLKYNHPQCEFVFSATMSEKYSGNFNAQKMAQCAYDNYTALTKRQKSNLKFYKG